MTTSTALGSSPSERNYGLKPTVPDRLGRAIPQRAAATAPRVAALYQPALALRKVTALYHSTQPQFPKPLYTHRRSPRQGSQTFKSSRPDYL
jgi:hypothetical protein